MTMNDTDKIKMTINIGGEHLQLSVDFNRQDAVRDAEKAAADLFNDFKLNWPSRSDKEILAMVAYRFAYHYQGLLERHQAAARLAEEIDSGLDAILRNDQENRD